MGGRAPGFWGYGRGGVLSAVLWPVSGVVAWATARRVARPGWRAPVGVICCGNAGVGGAGKTILVLDLAGRLMEAGVAVHLLTRGHGGRARGPVRVDLAVDDAVGVGDEALLLAACAPTWVGRDRGACARLAVAAGAEVLIMDDGLQNPTLVQDCGLLVIDGAVGFGNGRVLPAGPLREPVGRAAGRCRAAVLIGADAAGAVRALPAGLPVLRARLVAGAEVAGLVGRRVVAFAGIGRPGKFFDMLAAAGVAVVGRRGFGDHHRFSAGEMAGMRAEAARLRAVLVTTRKDFVRLGVGERGGVVAVGVSLVWEGGVAVEDVLGEFTGSGQS